ncbi:NfeD family protein [Nonomuraea antri]|uniref:NfeD family protein n=1 Tax=Nonomuraea antri TaxID=2730852 RepID=UPI001C2CC408|nr:NfeD family protein [Nonomuraea antri]
MDVAARAAWLAAGLLAVAFLAGFTPAGNRVLAGFTPAGNRVLATAIATEITPVVAGQVADGLRRAERDGSRAYVIELDTPGGLGESARDIVASILAARVPVIVYVSPQGARAASAGAVITLASHVAVMAPGTAIGAATPVGLQGQDLAAKVVNDAAAQAEALARLRGRDAAQAAAMVRSGRSLSVGEAVRAGVVEAEAATLAQALRAADGRQVQVAGGRTVTVRTAGAAVDRADPGFFQRARQVLANPNLAYLLLLLGLLGLIYELVSPGVGVAGGIGAVALLLALFSLAVLPVNAAGVLLLVLAAALFVAELFVPGTGGLAVAGGVALVPAALLLFDDAQGVRVEPVVAVPTAVVMVVLGIVAGRLAYRSRRGRVVSGTAAYLDRTVRIEQAEDGQGRAFMDGAWWTVRGTGPPLRTGDLARIVAVDGLTLVVEPLPEQGEKT